MGACGAFRVARAEVRGGMLCVRACRRAPPAVCMPKRPRIRSARAGQRPAPRHHQGEGHTAKSGRDSALARARSTVKCCQNPGQIKSEPRSDRIRTGGQMNRNPQSGDCRRAEGVRALPHRQRSIHPGSCGGRRRRLRHPCAGWPSPWRRAGPRPRVRRGPPAPAGAAQRSLKGEIFASLSAPSLSLSA